MTAQSLWKPEEGGKARCPVLEDPEPDCYCVNLTSLQLRRAFQYCLGDFRQCPVYLRIAGLPGFVKPSDRE